MRWNLILSLLGLFLTFSLAGCPPVNDDDDSDGVGDERQKCSGTYCTTADDCPDEEPDAGDACDFNANCHYCLPGSTEAEGYTCNGSTFSYEGTYQCAAGTSR